MPTWAPHAGVQRPPPKCLVPPVATRPLPAPLAITSRHDFIVQGPSSPAHMPQTTYAPQCVTICRAHSRTMQSSFSPLPTTTPYPITNHHTHVPHRLPGGLAAPPALPPPPPFPPATCCTALPALALLRRSASRSSRSLTRPRTSCSPSARALLTLWASLPPPPPPARAPAAPGFPGSAACGVFLRRWARMASSRSSSSSLGVEGRCGGIGFGGRKTGRQTQCLDGYGVVVRRGGPT